jgi:hypothetical protein
VEVGIHDKQSEKLIFRIFRIFRILRKKGLPTTNIDRLTGWKFDLDQLRCLRDNKLP